jgi:transposase
VFGVEDNFDLANTGGTTIVPNAAFSCNTNLNRPNRKRLVPRFQIASIDRSIMALHRGCEAIRRLAEIPGIGPIGATALVAEIGDWKTFSSGRSLAAWIGLVPKQHTTGGKDRLGSITKQGNRYLRWLLVVGAMALIRYARKHGTERRPWLSGR